MLTGRPSRTILGDTSCSFMRRCSDAPGTNRIPFGRAPRLGRPEASCRLSPEDSFPEVFATSRMIARMELAAARVMRPLLVPRQMSVRVSINVKHTPATPFGGVVRVVATYLGPEGKVYRFKAEAFDDGRSIAEGEHVRAIVVSERLLAGAGRRTP